MSQAIGALTPHHQLLLSSPAAVANVSKMSPGLFFLYPCVGLCLPSGPVLEHADSRGGVLLPRWALGLQLRPVPHSGAPRHRAPVPELPVACRQIATVPLTLNGVVFSSVDEFETIFLSLSLVLASRSHFCVFHCIIFVYIYKSTRKGRLEASHLFSQSAVCTCVVLSSWEAGVSRYVGGWGKNCFRRPRGRASFFCADEEILGNIL